MFAGTRDRRQVRKDRRQAAADRRIGHEYWWWYAGGDTVVKTVVIAAGLGVGAWFLWTRVDHRTIAAWAMTIGLALVVGSLAFDVIQVRRAGAFGVRAVNGVVLLLTGLAGGLFFIAGLMFWQGS